MHCSIHRPAEPAHGPKPEIGCTDKQIRSSRASGMAMIDAARRYQGRGVRSRRQPLAAASRGERQAGPDSSDPANGLPSWLIGVEGLGSADAADAAEQVDLRFVGFRVGAPA